MDLKRLYLILSFSNIMGSTQLCGTESRWITIQRAQRPPFRLTNPTLFYLWLKTLYFLLCLPHTFAIYIPEFHICFCVPIFMTFYICFQCCLFLFDWPQFLSFKYSTQQLAFPFFIFFIIITKFRIINPYS